MATTLQNIALRMLRYIGVVQIAPLPSGSENEDLQPGDLDDICTAVNGAMQELWDGAPGEVKERHVGAVLHAPTSVALDVVQYSNTVANITPWASWMQGCTIRIDGNDQDNEIVSQTGLAVPYVGTSKTGVHAIVYGDCIQLDSDVENVLAPVEIPNQFPIFPAKSREEFYRILGAPLVTDSGFGTFPASPFYAFYRRIIQRPRAWFMEGYLSPTSVARRMRFAPMPDTVYPLSFRVLVNPPKYVPADIVKNYSGGDYSDPGTAIPLPNDWIEGILLPVALQRFTAHPAFKNDAARQEIGRQYGAAKGLLSNSRSQISLTDATYL